MAAGSSSISCCKFSTVVTPSTVLITGRIGIAKSSQARHDPKQVEPVYVFGISLNHQVPFPEQQNMGCVDARVMVEIDHILCYRSLLEPCCCFLGRRWTHPARHVGLYGRK